MMAGRADERGRRLVPTVEHGLDGLHRRARRQQHDVGSVRRRVRIGVEHGRATARCFYRIDVGRRMHP